jgi:glucokinase
MQKNLTIGLDIGGTKMAFAVVDPFGNVCEETIIPTLRDNPYELTIERIAKQLNDYLKRYADIQGIGIGIPGPVDSVRGIALNAVNLLWENRPVKSDILLLLERDIALYVGNDVNVGAIGEQLYGVAKESPNYVYLTIGTGLGGAVMLDGKLMRGATSSEMEIGHISLDPINGRLCTCGQRGCVEMSVSGKGLVSNAEQHYADYPDTQIPADNISTHEIIHHARQGDALSQFVLDEAASALGLSCAWCTMLFNPSLIILGGGLIHVTYDLMSDKMFDTMRAYCLPQSYHAATVTLSKLTNAALGASALVWYFQTEEKTL